MAINVLSARGGQSPTLWSAGPYQFGAYADDDDQLVVVKFINQVFDDIYETGFTITDPTHGSPSVFVDDDDHIHVISTNTLPDLPFYIRSDVALSLESFSDNTGALPGPDYSSWNYVNFRPFSDGVVFAIWRHRDLTDVSEEAVAVASIYTGGVWFRQGEISHGAIGTEDAFYCNNPIVDDNDVVHIFGAWDSIYAGESVENHSYLRSIDRGVTWSSITGVALTTPITETSDSGIACRTGVDFGTGSDNLYSHAACVDENGYPCATYIHVGTGQMIVRWNGTSWITESSMALRYGGGQTMNLVVIKGDLWTLGKRSATGLGELRRFTSPNEEVIVSETLPSGIFLHADPVALRDTGAVNVLIPETTAPRIFMFGSGARGVAHVGP